MAIECHFVRAAEDLASLHICTGLPYPSSLYKISCAALNGDLCAIHASSEYWAPPGVLGILGEWLFIFRDLKSTGYYFGGAGEQAHSFGDLGSPAKKQKKK